MRYQYGCSQVYIQTRRLGGHRPISETTMGKVISSLRARKINGSPVLPIEKFTPHDLRRTMRSNLSRLGIESPI